MFRKIVLSFVLMCVTLAMAGTVALAKEKEEKEEKEKGQEKIGLCHATGSESNPYVFIEIAEPAVEAAHIDKDTGNLHGDGLGNQDFYADSEEECIVVTPTPTPVLNPTPTPTPPSDKTCPVDLIATLYNMETRVKILAVATSAGSSFDGASLIPDEVGVWIVIVTDTSPAMLTSGALMDEFKCLPLVYVESVDPAPETTATPIAQPSEDEALPNTAMEQ